MGGNQNGRHDNGKVVTHAVLKGKALYQIGNIGRQHHTVQHQHRNKVRGIGCQKGRQVRRIPQQGHEEQQPPGQHGKYNAGLHSGFLGKQAFQNGGALVCVAKIALNNAPRPLLGLPLLRGKQAEFVDLVPAALL